MPDSLQCAGGTGQAKQPLSKGFRSRQPARQATCQRRGCHSRQATSPPRTPARSPCTGPASNRQSFTGIQDEFLNTVRILKPQSELDGCCPPLLPRPSHSVPIGLNRPAFPPRRAIRLSRWFSLLGRGQPITKDQGHESPFPIPLPPSLFPGFWTCRINTSEGRFYSRG